MVSHSFASAVGILRLTFSGVFTTEDLQTVDPLLVEYVAAGRLAGLETRSLFDMTRIEALGVPQSRFAERASKPAIGDTMRVVVAPAWAAAEFGQSYRNARSVWPHRQPIVVRNMAEAYAILGVTGMEFDPVTWRDDRL